MQDTTKKYEYTGVSIRPSKECILILQGTYSSSPVNNLALGTDTEHQYNFTAHIESNINASHVLVVPLQVRTYYVWAGSVSNSNMRFDAYIFGNGGTVTVTPT